MSFTVHVEFQSGGSQIFHAADGLRAQDDLLTITKTDHVIGKVWEIAAIPLRYIRHWTLSDDPSISGVTTSVSDPDVSVTTEQSAVG